MTPHEYDEAIAAEVRAEMARQRKTQADLAVALDITPGTAGKRMSVTVPFDTIELFKVAAWLDVAPAQFYPRTEGGAA